ncbi:HPr kinase/phosphorylase [Sphingorhabdus sp.]|uniref:HPr kinase/phosphorylase n=1 Tax=Sphingorhabdus sp. TaxID=1902408 RepID=UPI003982E2CC
MLRNRPALRGDSDKLMREMRHGSAVAIDGHAVLIFGPSGSGKSDLALRLIDRGATLISDDMVGIESTDNHLVLSAAPNIAGKIELRGVGICTVDFVPSAPLALVVELTHDVDRMPSDDQRAAIGNFRVPMVKLDPFEPSSALKVEWALRSVIDAGRLPVAKQQTVANEGTGY